MTTEYIRILAQRLPSHFSFKAQCRCSPAAVPGSKPSDTDFLIEVIDQLAVLEADGFEFNGKTLRVSYLIE